MSTKTSSIKLDDKISQLIKEADNKANLLISKKNLFLENITKFIGLNSARQVIIIVPDSYIFSNPCFKQFAEFVKDEKTLSGENLFRFLVIVDGSFPQPPEANRTQIIDAKVSVLKKLHIPKLEIKKITTLGRRLIDSNIAGITDRVISYLGIRGKSPEERNNRVIILQKPMLITRMGTNDLDRPIKELVNLAKGAGISIIIPRSEKVRQKFNVSMLFKRIFKDGHFCCRKQTHEGVLIFGLNDQKYEIADEIMQSYSSLMWQAVKKSIKSKPGSDFPTMDFSGILAQIAASA